MDELPTKEGNADVLSTSLEPTSPALERGGRPACFNSTLQEVLFVLTATMAIGISSMTVGTVTVISSFIARDLNMTTAEITWVSASAS